MATMHVDFQSTPPPAHYRLAFEPFLYNQEAYLRLKSGERHSYYAVAHDRQQVLARIHFLLATDETGSKRAVSLPQSPFGSVEYGTNADKLLLYQFLRFIIKQLTDLYVREMIIKHHAPFYQSDTDESLADILDELNFSVNETLVNHHIVVDREEISHKLKSDKSARLKKCHRVGFTFRQEPLTSLNKIYEFVEGSYASRGRTLSLSRELLEEHIEAMPERYHFFSVHYQNEVVAATITVRSHPRILYTYSYTARASYNRYSPTVLLLSQVYRYCFQESIGTLDLGTSLTDSVQDFKRRMGGVPSFKCSYVKRLVDG